MDSSSLCGARNPSNHVFTCLKVQGSRESEKSLIPKMV